MNKLFLIGFLPALMLASCNKKVERTTRVGFYFEDKMAKGDISYDLYIDNNYEGKINVYNEEPADTSLLLFRILDDNKHFIDIKNGTVLLHASYLQITKNKTSSGTNKIKSQMVTGINGSRYREEKQKGYSVYTPFK